MKTQILSYDAADQVWNAVDPDISSETLVLYFGDTDTLKSGQPTKALGLRFPNALIAGCSAGTHIVNSDVEDAGAVAVAISFSSTLVKGASVRITDSSTSRECGLYLARQLVAPGLCGVMLLSDGLLVNGSQIVDAMTSVLGSDVPLSGGLAGDGPRFGTTLVGLRDSIDSGWAVAIGFYGSSLNLRHAAVGGWDVFGPPRQITRSVGNTVFELDDKPALDLYEKYLGEEAEGLPGTALIYPMQIWAPGAPQRSVVRTVLSVDMVARSLTFAGDMPQGWSAQLMHGVLERLVTGAQLAAGEAADLLPEQGSRNRLAILVSCVGRRLVMGQRTSDEIDAVSEVLGQAVKSVGFYSYGEIAPRYGKSDLHNQTMTVTLFDEVDD